MFMFYFLRHCILPCLEFEIDWYFQSGGQILGYQQHFWKMMKICWSFPGPGCLPDTSTVSSFMFSFFWGEITGQALHLPCILGRCQGPTEAMMPCPHCQRSFRQGLMGFHGTCLPWARKSYKLKPVL